MLNSHPQLVCPPETNLSAMFSAIAFTAALTVGDDEAGLNETNAVCRLVADRLMGSYTSAAGKSHWADKSLSSVEQAELLLRVYPKARFICLYRDCTDTIASLQEVCTWGYGAFGVEPYVRQAPGNLPLALANYWIDRVSAARSFEDKHPESCLRLRYEDLVSAPRDQLAAVFEFAGLASDAVSVDRAAAYVVGTDAMPGDLKAGFTTQTHTKSVGRGWVVPTEMLPPQIRSRVDEISAELGYAPLKDLAEGAGGTLAFQPSTIDEPPADLAIMLRSLSDRVAQRLADRPDQGNDSERQTSIKLVLTDAAAGPWVIDFAGRSVREGDAPAGWVAVTDSRTLFEIAEGQRNAGTALRESTLRVATAGEQRPDDFLDRVHALVELIKD